MTKLLLHACCAPCSAYSIQYFKNEGYEVTLYFYNPNIYPKAEHDRRLEELKRFCEAENYQLIIEEPDFANWFDRILGLENEPEKGARCKVCFDIRLDKTAQKAKELGFKNFTTTLSISPHKSYETICAVGLTLEEKYAIKFLPVNLKKKDGYKKSVALSQEYGFYRQDYCGCKFSLR